MEGPQLCPDVLKRIAQLLKGMEEFGAFRLASTLFSNLATMDDFNGLHLRRNVPYLMVPAKEDGTECEFFSLAKGKVTEKITLPEARCKNRFESKGWLLTFGGYREKGMSLLHPFEHLEIRLPNEETVTDYGWIQTPSPYEFVQKMVLSTSPLESSDFAVVIIYGTCRDWGFWKPGNRNWTRISIPNKKILDVTCLNHKFFAINSDGEIWGCDVNVPNPTNAQHVLSLPLDHEGPCYLVESSSGKLLIVAWRPGKFIADGDYYNSQSAGTRSWEEIRDLGGKVSYQRPGFDLFEVNTMTRTWKQVKDFGGKALFIGYSASLLVEATIGVKPDHIYYAGNAIFGQAAAWSYSLREKRRENLYQSNSTHDPLRPVWFSPIF